MNMYGAIEHTVHEYIRSEWTLRMHEYVRSDWKQSA